MSATFTPERLREVVLEFIEDGVRPSEALRLTAYFLTTIDLTPSEAFAFLDQCGFTHSTRYRLDKAFRHACGDDSDGRTRPRSRS